jgi:hypothetical protein
MLWCSNQNGELTVKQGKIGMAYTEAWERRNMLEAYRIAANMPGYNAGHNKNPMTHLTRVKHGPLEVDLMNRSIEDASATMAAYLSYGAEYVEIFKLTKDMELETTYQNRKKENKNG